MTSIFLQYYLKHNYKSYLSEFFFLMYCISFSAELVTYFFLNFHVAFKQNSGMSTGQDMHLVHIV